MQTPTALTKKQLLALERPRKATHFHASGGELKKPVVAPVADLDTMAGVTCVILFGTVKGKGPTAAFNPADMPAPKAAAPVATTKPAKAAKPAKPAKPAPAPKPAKTKPTPPPPRSKPAKKPKAAKPAQLELVENDMLEVELQPKQQAGNLPPPPPPPARKKPVGRTIHGATFSGISATEMQRVAAIVVEAGQLPTSCKATGKSLADVPEEAVKERLRHSIIPNPVSYAWEFFDNNRGMRRKDIIATLVSHGLAFYTARSQYQMWRTAGKADAERKGSPTK
jgi:hypothetical protein